MIIYTIHSQCVALGPKNSMSFTAKSMSSVLCKDKSVIFQKDAECKNTKPAVKTKIDIDNQRCKKFINCGHYCLKLIDFNNARGSNNISKSYSLCLGAQRNQQIVRHAFSVPMTMPDIWGR